MNELIADLPLSWRCVQAVCRRLQDVAVANDYPFAVKVIAGATAERKDLPAIVVIEGDEEPERSDGASKSMQQRLQVDVEGHLAANGENSDAYALTLLKAAIKRAVLRADARYLEDEGGKFARIALGSAVMAQREAGQQNQVVIVSFNCFYLEGYGDPTRAL